MITLNKTYSLLFLCILGTLTLHSQFATYSTADDAKSEFNNHGIDNNKKVLKLSGKSSVLASGNYNFNFNIDIPEGVNKMTPSINLSYISGMGDNQLGIGWSIGGISSISRTNKNYYYDGKNKHVDFTSSDPFELDGKRLQPKNGNNGQNGEEYEFENESYSIIKSFGAFNSISGNPEYFEVIGTNGQKLTYGKFNSSTIYNQNNTSILTWYLSKVEDNYGNTIEYFYDKPAGNNELVLTSIKYGSNSKAGTAHIFEVKFNYLEKPTLVSSSRSFVDGSIYEKKRVLDNIEIYKSNILDKTYKLYYYQDNINSYLYKINLFNHLGESLNPIIFSYDHLQKNSTDITSNNVITDREKSLVIYHDFNGDAINDMVELNYESIKMGNSTDIITRIMSGLEYPGASILKATGIKFFKNDYNGNKATNTNFTLTNQFDLKNGNLILDHKLLLNQNFRYGSLDLNFDGINDIVIHELFTDNTFVDCNLGFPSKIVGLMNDDLNVYRKSIYFEYDKSTNNITPKTLPIPTLPTVQQLGFTNPVNNPYILNPSNNPFFIHRYFPSTFFIGDFDGDGFNDYINCLQLAVDDNSNNLSEENLVCQNIKELVSMLYISFPKNNSYNQWLSLSKTGVLDFRDFCLGAQLIEVVEFNGNGKSDIFVKKGTSIRIYEWDEMNNDFILIHNSTGSAPTTFEKLAFGDFNGDGKIDLYTYNNSSSYSSNSAVYNSDGKNFIFSCNSTKPVDKLISINNNKTLILDYNPIVTDFNGDGISDIAIVTDSTWQEYICIDWREPVIGSNYCAEYGWRITGYSYNISVNYKNQKQFIPGYSFDVKKSDKPWVYSTTDINGDNKADFFHQFTSGNQLKYVCSNFENSDRNMTAIRNSFGEYQTIEYSRMNDKYKAIYSESNFNVNDINLIKFKSSTGNLVRKVYTMNQGFNDNETVYSYQDLIAHRQGKGTLGFKKNNITLNGGTLFTINYFSFSKDYNYFPQNDKIISDDGFQSSTIINEFNATKRTGTNKVIQILPSYSQTSKRIGSNQKILEEVEYNYTGLYDNLESIYTLNSYIKDFTLNTKESIKSTFVKFDNYVNKGSTYPNKATRIESETKDLLQNLTDTKITIIDYKNEGGISRENSNYQKPCEMITDYIYDIFGNRVEVVQNAIGKPTRTNKTIYDTRGLNVFKTINAQNQTISEINYNIKEQPINKKDVRGIYTDLEYDNWGNLKKIKERGKNIFTEYSTEWGGSTRGGYYYSLTKDQSGSENYSYFDIDGKVLMTQTTGRFNNDIFKYFEYDNRGRIIKESKPYLITETPIEETKVYNSFNQLESYTNESGTFNVSYIYQKDRTIVTTSDPSGKTKSTSTDILGRTFETIDNINNKVSHTFNPANQILTTKVNGKININNIYNSCGLLISQEDISNGTSIFDYDAWGQIISNKNARNQTEIYEYDDLGKKTKTKNPEGEVTYSYNTFGNGINQLAKIFLKGTDSKDDVLELMFYDSKSRLISHKKQIGGVTMKVKYQYNDRNQITKKIFNSGVSLDYNYDAHGFLVDIKDNYGKLIYKINSTSGLDQPLNYTLGNGLTTHNTFIGSYPNNFNTTNYLTGQIILDYNLNIDPSTGNVQNRDFIKSSISGISLISWFIGGIQKNSEVFTYDNLDRLSEINTNGVIQNINYDNIGNITDKYDVGDYYNNDKNQVRAVTNDYGNISLEDQKITYTSFEQPYTLFENKNWLRYSYSSNQQRFRAQWRSSLTNSYNSNISNFYNLSLEKLRYYFDDFELNCEVNGATGSLDAEYIHYVRGIDGKMVSLIRKPCRLDVNAAMNTAVMNPAIPTYESHEINGKIVYIWTSPINQDEEEIIYNPNAPQPPLSEYYFIYTDHIGSLLTFTDDNANVIHEQNFDAWGRYRDPNTFLNIPIASYYSFIYRGYTEHEHIDEFGLINMNGRMYDPILGRFLSTDESINDPSNSQSYNRYTYCLNNPLKYSDPSGEIVDPITSFVTGVVIYGIESLFNGQRVCVFGALNAGTVYSVNSIVSSLVGDGVSSLIPIHTTDAGKAIIDKNWFLNQAVSVPAHALSSGTMSAMMGGDFIQGATSGAISSAMGSVLGLGLESTGIDGKSFGGQAIGTISGGIQGFIVDKYINNGDGWSGAVIGAVVVASNHFTHLEPEIKKSNLLLYFDGQSITIIDMTTNNIVAVIPAVSGRPLDNGTFDYSIERQKLEKIGPIPEGNYNVNSNKTQKWSDLSFFQKTIAFFKKGRFPNGTIAWGSERVDIVPNGVLTTRYGFTIHGGAVAGSAGCIDLTIYDRIFFNIIRGHGLIDLIVNYKK